MTHPDSDEFILVLVTMPSEETAQMMARKLVEERLIACLTLIPGARSIYRWNDQVTTEVETLCIAKTRREHFEALRERILALHPYEIPEIIATPLTLGHPAYLAWVRAETQPKK